MKNFVMPSLGADMEGGTLVEWVKSPGDPVHRGDIVAVVETVKGAIEIECFDEGRLAQVLVEPGTTVAVGEVLARLDAETPDVAHPKAPAPAPRDESAAPARLAEEIARRDLQSAEAGPASERVRASPAARRRAQEVGIDLKSLRPGPDGVIGISEVAAAIEARRERQPALAHGPPHAPETAPEAGSATGAKPGLDRDAMRRAIGAAMARSKREIPHYYVSSTLDVTAFLKWLEALNAQRSVEARILYAAPLFKAVALALKAAPQLNGTFADGRHNPSAAVHVGVATALRGGGLIAPALHDTGGLALDEAMSRLRDIVSRVRTGRIRSSEMTDATVTLSMLGDDTADTVQPVIYPPQVAIIGCGAIRERPWVVEGAIVPRRVINVTVAGDHRVSDGRVAARFLKRLEALLGDPAQLEETDKP